MGKQQLKMGKGQNEGGFSEEQLQMYKDCFKLMDINKDGQLDKNDLRGAFDNVGVLMSESELDGLLGEIGGACTNDNMVKMFQEKMAGDGNDSDDLIVHALMTWGDKMTKAEIDDIFGEFEIDEDYMIKTKDVIGCSSPSRRSLRSRSPPPLRKLRPSPRRTPMPRRRRRRRRRSPSKLAVFSTFMPRLWSPLKRQPTMKTPHSIQKKGNMKASIGLIQTILSAGIPL